MADQQIMEELSVEVKVFWGIDFLSIQKQKKTYAQKHYPYVNVQNIARNKRYKMFQGQIELPGNLTVTQKVNGI